ncbi:hypothetical protein HPB51_018356 [Rhipicephalus microplus]|uniref:Ribose-phosphate pyrophosphokinase N-terminal domain-containing protein n=1 Tax=Rhipicephalus microplus TaxID=6941 RepID=A0A9J6EUH4_RHIMP|nr:hypothetical protein HPB51_018356 [Rhipicephalus microplus]
MERASEIILLAGNSHLDLAQKIAERLGIRVGNCTVVHSANRETLVDIGESVRSRDVYIIQTGSKDVNNSIMELLIMAYCCKTSCARKIVGVIPYLPYGKQSKMRKRGCIVSKLLAQMLVKAGLTHIITMDLHQKEVQGFFDIPVDNLRASPFLLQYITECIPDYRNAVIVARNPSTANKATSYAERLRLGIAVIHGEQKESESDMVDGRYSPPTVLLPGRTMEAGLDIMPVPAAKEKPPIYVVGDVGGRIAIMVGLPRGLARMRQERVRYSPGQLMVSHAIFRPLTPVAQGSSDFADGASGPRRTLTFCCPFAYARLKGGMVVVTNTVPHEVQKMQCHKIKTVDISVLLSEAIRRIHHKESMSYLFRNVTLED